MTLRSDTKFEEKLFCCFKNDKNLANFDLNIQNSQNFHFNWFLLCEVYNVSPKKYRGVIFHDTEEWCRKTERLLVLKITWGIWQIFTRALESLKIGTSLGCFYPKEKMYEFKIYRGVCVMTMKSDAKFDQKLTCCFKIDMRNLKNFDLSTWKFQKFAL